MFLHIILFLHFHDEIFGVEIFVVILESFFCPREILSIVDEYKINMKTKIDIYFLEEVDSKIEKRNRYCAHNELEYAMIIFDIHSSLYS